MNIRTFCLRCRLRHFIPQGRFETVITNKFRTTGFIVPRKEGELFAKLQESRFKGKLQVLYPYPEGGKRCFRPLESRLLPSEFISHPEMKIRLQVVGADGEALGFIEPELFFGFLPDWEERL